MKELYKKGRCKIATSPFWTGGPQAFIKLVKYKVYIGKSHICTS